MNDKHQNKYQAPAYPEVVQAPNSILYIIMFTGLSTRASLWKWLSIEVQQRLQFDIPERSNAFLK